MKTHSKTLMMMVALVPICILLLSCHGKTGEKDDLQAIKQLLSMQEEAWSNNDIDRFMEAYQQSDSITYFGSSGIRRGYQAMLNSYKERYPTKAHTGTLKFTLHDISKISEDAYWVMGEYHLTRDVGDTNGTFMIVLKRINGEWKIVGDSSC
ncbi:YybH family protein [Allomuricauda sp. SCSIO 65647]|uniref:YybH family protein n=1 Tax=Allomuricauda sp. SCSIO 65647 TaxID=2908843 RepID=UPI001F2AAB72|nr:nuclear transport factor 2 family protein [Muricauda sp. SCSIO 65647]UJH67829.1 nuclear transport factor 2 family protein [Muricauda sp. SCSIO 65647]